MNGDLGSVLKQLVEGMNPDLRKYFRPSLLGRVDAVHEAEYRVDVIVGGDGTTENPGLALPDVPVASLFAQDGYGIWALPEVDAEVTISFYEGDVTQPYVEAPRWDKNGSPQGFTTGTIAIRGKQGQKLEFKPATNEIVLSAASVKIIGTDKRQEAIEGDQPVRVNGSRTTTVAGEESLTADSWKVTVAKKATISAQSLTETTRGDLTQQVGGSLNQRVAGGVSRQVAGGATDAVAFSKREIVGGSYQMLVAATPGIADPLAAYSILVGSPGKLNLDALGGEVNIGAGLTTPPLLVNIGSATPGLGPVYLGGVAALAQPAVVGNVLYALLTALLTALKTPLQIGNLGAPTIPNPAFIALIAPIEALMATLLSSKVFVAPI
jgi:hypothetical protein